MKLKAILFDLDGTLVDSSINFKKMKKRIIDFLEISGVKKGYLSTNISTFDIEDQTLIYLKSKGFDEKKIQNILFNISKIMNEIELESLRNVTLFKGVFEALEILQNHNLKIGIITRACREYTIKILEKFKLNQFIDVVVARDDVTNPKPDPAHSKYLMALLDVKPSETILVGDHPLDVLCAKNSGLNCYIISNNPKILKGKPNRIVKNISELIEILQNKFFN